MSDLTQQALTALADAGLGNESAAESFVLGYQTGYDAALNLAIRIENELNSDEPTDKEIETCARGFFEGTPGPTNWDAVSEVSKQAWLHAAKKALAAVNAMKNEGTTMNENTALTDIIDAALAAGCQISVTVTPKDFYEQETEE